MSAFLEQCIPFLVFFNTISYTMRYKNYNEPNSSDNYVYIADNMIQINLLIFRHFKLVKDYQKSQHSLDDLRITFISIFINFKEI